MAQIRKVLAKNSWDKLHLRACESLYSSSNKTVTFVSTVQLKFNLLQELMKSAPLRQTKTLKTIYPTANSMRKQTKILQTSMSRGANRCSRR